MQFDIDARSERLALRKTSFADLDFVLAAEQHPENAPYVNHWTREKHSLAFDHPDQAHWLIETLPEREPVGYVLMTGFEDDNRCLYFKRLVIVKKGHGYGRQTVKLVKKLAFEQFRAHRLWLDVVIDNDRARQLYLSEGFVEEGILREDTFFDGRYLSHIVMSILAHEYS